MTTAAELDNAKVQKLEAELDPEMRFRPLLPAAGWLVAVWLFGLSCFHYYTAGFGLLPETLHRGIHISCVLGLIFLVFSWSQKGNAATPKAGLFAPLGIGIVDWLCAIAAVVTSLYVPYVFHDLQFRVGNPDPIDWIMGTVMIVVLLEATRRSVGWPLPIIAVVLMIYALYGRSLPGILAHPGNTWKSVVNHLYLTSQGIYGIALGVVATYVVHYVLFGVLATRVGLGRFFIDLATALTGRFSGGPAKVSIFGSAMFGMISGSSIANTVTDGSLTIPAMIRIGYARHFAGAVEAAAATGGAISPAIIGAAPVPKDEVPAVPLHTNINAAVVPAWFVLRDEAGNARLLDILDAFVVGAKYAISVGAAAATVGIIIGVVTLTGVGFKLSTIITGAAADFSTLLGNFLPESLFDAKGLTLFFTLGMTAIVCILLGCGVPTTPTYLTMGTIRAPPPAML